MDDTIIWACDPGAHGAFVRMISLSSWKVHQANKLQGYRDAIHSINADLMYYEKVVALIEDLNMRVGDQKKAKMISEMLKNAGRALLAFELAGIQPEEIPAKNWQYAFGLVGYEYEERKKLAKKLAIYYFGDATLADADAKLIALWKYWQLNGIEPPRKPKEIISKLTITKEVVKKRNG